MTNKNVTAKKRGGRVAILSETEKKRKRKEYDKRYESLESSPSSSCKETQTDTVHNTQDSVKTQTVHNTQDSAKTQTVHNTQDSAISGSRDIVYVPVGNQSPQGSTPGREGSSSGWKGSSPGREGSSPGREGSSSGCDLNRTTCISTNSQSETEIPVIFMPYVLVTSVKSET